VHGKGNQVVWRELGLAPTGEQEEAEGSLPDCFDGLRRQLLEQQYAAGGSEADVDYVFSIPLDATKLVTGFSHEEHEPDDGFAVLAQAADD
jgi:hypothetical protein